MDILLIDNSNIYCGLKDRYRYPFQKARFNYLGFVASQFKDANQVMKILVGSTPPPSDAFWVMMRNNGFHVVTFERDSRGEKQVDTEIVAQGLDAINECCTPGRLVLMSGDSDMRPLVKRAHERSWRVEIWTWKDSIKSEYAKAQEADVVRFIDDIQDDLVFHEPTGVDPYRETYAQYIARKDNERMEREKECKRQRLEREEALQRQREELERQQIEKAQRRREIWERVKGYARPALRAVAFVAVPVAAVVVAAVSLTKKRP